MVTRISDSHALEQANKMAHVELKEYHEAREWAHREATKDQVLAPPEKLNNSYALTYACYRSGQMTQAQLEEHLQDPLFAAWYKKNAKP